MKLICPKCLGMKKFYVGVPVSRKCDKHSNNMIHINNIIEMPADPEPDLLMGKLAKELPEKEGETSLKIVLAVIPDLDVGQLRSVAKQLKVKSWWIQSKKNLIAKIRAALKAKYAAA